MDNRKWEADAILTPPIEPVSPANGYPTNGDPLTAQNATEPGEWWFHAIGEEIRAVIVEGGLTPNISTLTQLRDAIRAISKGYMSVRDEKATNTVAGSSVTTAMPTGQTRVLNTVASNTISGASLGSNQITLPSGKYRVVADAPSTCNSHRAYLYNVTDAVVTLLGSNENSHLTSDTDPISTRSIVRGTFTIAGTKVFELRHYTSEASANIGLGAVMNNSGFNEVYSQVEIIKES